MAAFDEDSIWILSDESLTWAEARILLSQSGPPSHASNVVGAAAASADFWCGSRFLIGASPARIPLLARTCWWG